MENADTMVIVGFCNSLYHVKVDIFFETLCRLCEKG